MDDPNIEEFLGRIERREAIIGVVGLGYVGLPLVLTFVTKGFSVVGFDIDPEKVEALNAGRSYIEYIPAQRVGEMVQSGKFRATADPAEAGGCDALLLCLPTPLTRNREPDMSYIERTCETFAPHLKRGSMVVLESTTWPGTTRELMVPILEAGSGLKAEEDFYTAYSPEREDPNNAQYNTATIPKVVGADSPGSRAIAEALYSAIVEKTVVVSSSSAAEATKLVENIFRCVNIAMVNELKMVFQRMDIDIWEVVRAAATKPFGYMPFYPGPGLGGHCIPIDPFYLTWKAREVDMPTKFIELAGEINTHMPYYVVARTMEALNEEGKALKGARLLLIGLAYKKDVDDLRESPALKLIDLFEARGATVDYHDPHIPAVKPTREYPHLAGRKSTPIEQAAGYDAVVIATNHSALDYRKLLDESKIIVDTRNAFTGLAATGCKIHRA